MRAWTMVLVAVALLGGGCRKKAPLVPTPVSQLEPLGGTAPAEAPLPAADDNPRGLHQPLLQPADVPDAGASRAVITPPKTTTTPTVASPYVPGGGAEHLPMWKQRAKFY